ncbi:MAG: rRNA pseudouridine synthase [Clostridium sp.]|nr:rRNA pseudouridine synthase [Clostridium sp.]
MAEQKKTTIRLDKFLTEMGQGTRSQVKEMARKGRIAVNGQVVRQADVKINPEADNICLDGARVAYARTEYYMLNKPQGVVSATEDGRYRTVTELITGALRSDLFPVGRLDIDTEGLLLLTNDGALAHSLLSPKKHVDKVYFARIEGLLPEDACDRVMAGLVLEDGTKTLPALLEIMEPGQVRLTIREGKFHQVKRMFEAMGCRVTYLKRLSMGPLTLDPALAPGEYRPLTEREIRTLQGCQETQKRV